MKNRKVVEWKMEVNLPGVWLGRMLRLEINSELVLFFLLIITQYIFGTLDILM